VGNLRKRGITLLKIAVSILLLYFIFTKIDFQEIAKSLKTANFFYLILALMAFITSKVISAFRLNLYFHQLKIFLTQRSNLKLYVLGMFYNLFLPGGIGGDAYKGYIIKKKFQVETKKLVSALVVDRISGVAIICVFICLFTMLIRNQQIADLVPLFLIAIPIGVGIFYLATKKFFAFTLPIFWKALWYSTLVQAFQLVAVLFILKSLGIITYQLPYLFIFLISSLVSVIPLTLGGIGSRELTFFYGASLLHLSENISISVSVLFFLITALTSLIGIYYHFRKIELEVVNEKS